MKPTIKFVYGPTSVRVGELLSSIRPATGGYHVFEVSGANDILCVAETFGWRKTDCQTRKHKGLACDHRSTDGHAPCSECVCTYADFVASAREYLAAHNGDIVPDPGYFPLDTYVGAGA